jgi:hypothetical protein
MSWKFGFFANAAFIVLVTAACAGAKSATRREACSLTGRDSAYLVNGPVYRPCEVDKPAIVAHTVAFSFQPTPGRTTCYSAEIEFVVDTLGSPEVRTLHVVSASDHDFADALVAAVSDWRYSPAQLDGHPVRQIVTTTHRASPVPVKGPDQCRWVEMVE